MPGPRLKLPKDKLTKNRNAVAPVERNSTHIKNTRDRRVRPKTNQVNGNAPENTNPDREDRRTREREHFGPDVAEGQQLVAGEGEDGAREGLHSSESDEFDDDEGADGEDYAAGFAEDVVEDLGDGLGDGRGEDGVGVGGLVDVAHDEAEDDVEEEAGQVGEEHGHGDGPGGFDLRVFDFFGDVCGCVVVGPGDGQLSIQEARLLLRCPTYIVQETDRKPNRNDHPSGDHPD